MRKLAFMAIAVGGLSWFGSSDAQAADRSPFQLLPSASVAADGSAVFQAIPVRTGYGWRGPGYYPGWGRPAYGGGYRGGYYGGYYNRPYYGGYGGYYRGGSPYYSGYRGYGRYYY